MKVVTNISGNVGNQTWNKAAQQVTVGDFSNPTFLRAVQLTNNGLLISRPGIQVGFPIPDLLAAAVIAEPNLTWKPSISVQPVSISVVHPAAASFNIVAASETGVATNYQWQISTDNGTTWANQADGGVYSGCITNTISISNSTGLNGDQYRCQPYNVAGTTTSNAAKLTVT